MYLSSIVFVNKIIITYFNICCHSVLKRWEKLLEINEMKIESVDKHVGVFYPEGAKTLHVFIYTIHVKVVFKYKRYVLNCRIKLTKTRSKNIETLQ